MNDCSKGFGSTRRSKFDLALRGRGRGTVPRFVGEDDTHP